MDENKRLICNEELIEEKNRRLEKFEYLNESDFSKISQTTEMYNKTTKLRKGDY